MGTTSRGRPRFLTGVVALSALALVGCGQAGVGVSTVPQSAIPSTPFASSAAPTPAPSSPAASAPTSGSASASKAPSAAPKSAPSTSKASVPASVATTLTSTPFEVGGVVLVNKQHAVARTYVPALSTTGAGLRPEAQTAMNALIAGAKKSGFTLSVLSAYRSWDRQSYLFTQAVKNEGAATARLYVAEAGKSEHQTGLAADMGNGSGSISSFTGTPQAAWLAKHATDYGFILRYPQGKTAITGYAYESWHIRYVGAPVAQQFAAHPGLTLEEYLGLA
jgi:D-alanyl-D-alanine carboxypeptidase